MITRLQGFHHVVDYALGILLIVGPWLFRFSESAIGVVVTVVFGMALIGASVATADRLSPRRLPWKTHLAAEAIGGGLLIGAPWIFGFSHYAWVPHVAIGAVIAARGLLGAAGATAYDLIADEAPEGNRRR